MCRLWGGDYHKINGGIVMWDDPIVKEVREIREIRKELSARFNFDVHAIFEDCERSRSRAVLKLYDIIPAKKLTNLLHLNWIPLRCIPADEQRIVKC
jgi:hypothetical protein